MKREAMFLVAICTAVVAGAIYQSGQTGRWQIATITLRDLDGDTFPSTVILDTSTGEARGLVSRLTTTYGWNKHPIPKKAEVQADNSIRVVE